MPSRATPDVKKRALAVALVTLAVGSQARALGVGDLADILGIPALKSVLSLGDLLPVKLPALDVVKNLKLPDIPKLQILDKVVGLDDLISQVPKLTTDLNLPKLPTVTTPLNTSVNDYSNTAVKATSAVIVSKVDIGGSKVLSLDVAKGGDIDALRANVPNVHMIYLPDAKAAADAKCGSVNRPKDCPQYEYYLPILPNEVAEHAATEYKNAWTRYQDRAYWHMTMSLNRSTSVPTLPQPLYTSLIANCTPLLNVPATVEESVVLGLFGKSQLAEEKVSTLLTVPGGIHVKEFSANKTFDAAKYSAITDIDVPPIPAPRINRDDYCADITPELIPDEVPLLGVYTPNGLTCFLGACTIIDPATYPFPVSVNWDKISRRLTEGCKQAAGYWRDYEADVATTTAKYMTTGMLTAPDSIGSVFNTPLATLTIPVASLDTDLPSVVETAKKSRIPEALPYYLSLPNRLTLTQQTATANAPGLLNLEELKRYWPITNPLEQERFGKADLFQAWTEINAVVDKRPLLYWTNNVTCQLGIFCVPTGPAVPVPVSETVITETGQCAPFRPGPGIGLVGHIGQRMHFGWTSVPEGYAVPYANSKPLIIGSAK